MFKYLKTGFLTLLLISIISICHGIESSAQILKNVIGDTAFNELLTKSRENNIVERNNNDFIINEIKNSAEWDAFLNPYSIMDVIETETHLWLGSTGGILKVNKDNLTYETLNNVDLGTSYNNISAIKLAPNGDIWIGYISSPLETHNDEGGISIIHTNGSVSNLNRANSEIKSHYITDFLFDDNGDVWISYGVKNPEYGGISIIRNNGQWEHFNSENSELPSNTILSMYLDSQSRKWICLFGDHSSISNVHENSGLLMIENDEWTFFTTEINDYESNLDDEGNEGPKSWQVRDIVEDSQGNLWFTLNNRGARDNQVGLYKYDNETFTGYGQEVFSDLLLFWKLSIDSDDRVWVIDVWNNVALFDSNQWSLYSTEQLLQNIFCDSYGRVWVSFGGGHIGYFDNEEFFLLEYGLDSIPLKYNYINKITAKDGNVFIATGEFGTVFSEYNSLLIKTDDVWLDYGFELFNTYGTHDVKFFNDNDFVVATGPHPGWHNYAVSANLTGGVAVYENYQWTNHTIDTTGYPFVWANTATKDVYGNIWAGSYLDGVAIFTTGWQIVNNIYSDAVVDIVADMNSPLLWMATPFGLVKYYLTPSGFSGFEVYHPGNSNLPSMIINQIVFDDYNNLWIATDMGLAVYANGNIENYNSELGTFSVSSVTLDEFQRVWVATNDRGIFMIDSELQIHHYNIENTPLPTNNIKSLASDKEGKLWINPYGNGIYVFDYEQYTGLTDYNLPLRSFVEIYPNPFNPNTTVKLNLAESGHTKIEIYNVKGQRIETLLDAFLPLGTHEILWNGTNDNNKTLGSGVYFVKVQSPQDYQINKILLIK